MKLPSDRIRVTARRTGRRWLAPLRRVGIDPVQTFRHLAGSRWYRKTLHEYESQRRSSADSERFPANTDKFKVVTDRSSAAGTISGHYFHQDLWVARRIFQDRPRRHVDFGSRIDGFVAHVASFRPVEIGDIRPLDSSDPWITSFQVDLTRPESVTANMTDSASCLNALEHFGLGRYGDPVDYHGWSKGLESLTRVVEPGGRLYLSVPITSRERVQFNAHRLFAVPTIHAAVLDAFDVEEFVYVDDDGDLHDDIVIDGPEYRDSFGLTFGCGIWVLRKTGSSPQPGRSS